ncbi:MAG: class I SAM-dependent methyltransferase [Acidimicrobiales bacterium]|jgi:SAM-dependent methyltransferase
MSSTPQETAPNAEQVRFWNDVSGPLWVEFVEEMDLHTAAFGDPALEKAAPRPGERVLDVGCGCGSTTVFLGEIVGRGGKVVGIDVSSVMLQRARERVQGGGHDNVELREADAQIADLPKDYFDLAFSRFGVMFFSDPERAFSNIASSLRVGGRITFVCWQAPEKNPWMAVPMSAALGALEVSPSAPGDGPGPFFFSDPERIRRILESADLQDVDVVSLERDSLLTGPDGLDRWAHHRILMGVGREAYEVASEEVRERVRDAVVNSVAEFVTQDGLSMPGAAWIVQASRR